MTGWWHDPVNGLSRVHTANPADRDLVRVLVLHNGFLNDGPKLVPSEYYDPPTQSKMPYPESQTDTFWRQLHQHAGITPRAPETVRIFDASRRGCWAVIVTPGTSVDVQWASPEEVETKLRVPVAVA